MENFDVWNEHKKKLHCKESDYKALPKECEVWWCALGINIGDEEDGKNELFERPVLIFRVFNKELAWVIPLTSKHKNGAYYYSFIHDGGHFTVLLSQLRLVSSKRLYRKIYSMPGEHFRAIREKMKLLM